MNSRLFSLGLALLALAVAPAHAQSPLFGAPGACTEKSAPARPCEPGRVLAVGERILVEWGGTWYLASVVAHGDGAYLVHYEGWGSEWDEHVPAARIRLDLGPPLAPPRSAQAVEKPALPEAWSEDPVGHWRCRSAEATGSAFTLRSDGTYEDPDGTGQYSFDPATQAIRFQSGPRKAQDKGRFRARGHGGKGHLRIVHDDGATLDCARESL